MLEDEGVDVFGGIPDDDELESETLDGSPPEEKTEEEEPSQDGDKPEESTDEDETGNSSDEDNVPFHKHPRWKEREMSHKKDLEDLNDKINELKQSKQPPVDTAVPQEFTDLFGSDVPAGTYQKLKKLMDSSANEAVSQYKQEQETSQSKFEAERKKYEAEYAIKISEVVKSNKINKNAFVKYFTENPIYDSSGQYDFEKGAEYFALKNPAKKSDKKSIISDVSKSGNAPVSDGELKVWMEPDLRGKK